MADAPWTSAPCSTCPIQDDDGRCALVTGCRETRSSAPTPTPDCSNPSRYPWAPLKAFFAVHLDEIHDYNVDSSTAVVGPTDNRIAEQLGVSQRTISRWKHDGLNDVQADHVATKLGRHPSYFWPEWTNEGLAPIDRLFPLEEWWRPAWEAA